MEKRLNTNNVIAKYEYDVDAEIELSRSILGDLDELPLEEIVKTQPLEEIKLTKKEIEKVVRVHAMHYVSINDLCNKLNIHRSLYYITLKKYGQEVGTVDYKQLAKRTLVKRYVPHEEEW
jgi:hypothetical protein